MTSCHVELSLPRTSLLFWSLPLLLTTQPVLAQGKPAVEPVRVGGFGLLARANLRWIGNRVRCFVASHGMLCSAETSTIGGGYWPAGSNNQYIYNSGLQIAGIIDPVSPNNPWAGDTAGAFFFNSRGGGNGQAITDIHDGSDPDDLAAWPVEAYVPSGSDQAAGLFDPSLQGRKTASDRDIWFLSWEGDPALSGGRSHPLGVMVETRGLAYVAEAGQDVAFFLFTFYNITASNPATYAQAAPRLQARLKDLGSRFQQLNEAGGLTLPDDGYTIRDMYFSIGTDFDVSFSESGSNYSSVNVPLGMGYSYHASFGAPTGWSFADGSIYRPPFFPGAGFAGIKFLKTPEVNSQQRGLTLFASTTGGGEFSDPRNDAQLYRYMIGRPDGNLGDDQCFVGDPDVTHICYVNQGSSSDTRFFQVSGPITLGPGEYRTVAAAYVFAAPVATGACTGPAACGSVPPQRPTGDVTRFTNPAALLLGANTVDSIAGFHGWGDTTFTRRLPGGDSTVSPNGVIDQEELIVVPGSLLGKARAAQAIFDNRFVTAMPPSAPDFFLIPGDDQVTVIWRPSVTESDGDPAYSLAQLPETFDPNYRQYDLAGYRIYRGTSDDPERLRLLAQFDLKDDIWYDRSGRINQVTGEGYSRCAPALGVFAGCTGAGTVNGVPTITPIAISLDGPVTQWQSVVASGAGIDTVITVDTTVSPPDTTVTYVPITLAAFASKVDTALTGGNNPRPALAGTGVPFVFVDRAGNCDACGVANHRRYYYVVTAFDLNSIQSGPSSLESARQGAKSVVIGPPPVNATPRASVDPFAVRGRNGPLTDTAVPVLDPGTGRFSKPFPPANGAVAALNGFVAEVVPDHGEILIRLDSLQLGESSPSGSAPIVYFWHLLSSGVVVDSFASSLAQNMTFSTQAASAGYRALPLDSARASRYGGGVGYSLVGSLGQTLAGLYYTNAYGRGCVNAADGFVPGPGQGGCNYNGPRWFLGPSPTANETMAHPIAGNGDNFNPGAVNNALVVGGVPNGGFNNAGQLPNVQVIHQPYSYQTMGNQWREIEGVLAGAKRAADYNVYWSGTTPGLIDSVIDVTHDVVVPFLADHLAGSYGLLTQANAQPSGVDVSYDQRTELSLTDFGCVEPLRTRPTAQNRIPCGAANVVGDGPTYTLTRQAVIGPIVHFTTSPADARTSLNVGQGFAMYLAGNLFMFQSTTLPAGTVWALRDYVGAITGGSGYGGNDGPYAFYPVMRPFAAVGASVGLSFVVDHTVRLARDRDLRRVHTVPDPYYERSPLEASIAERVIKFVNLPERAIIRIYTVSGVLVTVLEHNDQTSSEASWDLRNRDGRLVASGVYFWHVEALNARRVGRMTLITAYRR